MAIVRKAATAPSQPTEEAICAVRANFRSWGFMVVKRWLLPVYWQKAVRFYNLEKVSKTDSSV
jgi:hypothetical protein